MTIGSREACEPHCSAQSVAESQAYSPTSRRVTLHLPEAKRSPGFHGRCCRFATEHVWSLPATLDRHSSDCSLPASTARLREELSRASPASQRTFAEYL